MVEIRLGRILLTGFLGLLWSCADAEFEGRSVDRSESPSADAFSAPADGIENGENDGVLEFSEGQNEDVRGFRGGEVRGHVEGKADGNDGQKGDSTDQDNPNVDGSATEDGLAIDDGEKDVEPCIEPEVPTPLVLGPSVADVKNALNAALVAAGMPALPGGFLRKSTGATGGGFRWTSYGTNDVATLEAACQVLGYRTYGSSTCLDSERSGRYPSGKCNFHSPGDNALVYFDNTTGGWRAQASPSKYQTTWVATLTCHDPIPKCPST